MGFNSVFKGLILCSRMDTGEFQMWPDNSVMY